MSDPELNAESFCFPRARIGRAWVDCCSLAEAVEVITCHATLRGPSACVVTPNAQHVVLLESDAGLQEAYAHADLVLADGTSLLIASRLLGEKLRDRVAGIDLFEQLCCEAAEHGLRVFLLGGHPGSAQLAAEKLKRRFPDLQVVGTYCPPVGFEHDQHELQAIGHAIRRTQPDLVFVALGAPKQESWMHRQGRHSGAPVLIGVGGSFEMVGGVLPRAPRFLQSIGCEWLYRLLLEPRRLWKRYLIGNCRFLWIVLRQRAAQYREKPYPSQHTSLEAIPHHAPAVAKE